MELLVTSLRPAPCGPQCGPCNICIISALGWFTIDDDFKVNVNGWFRYEATIAGQFFGHTHFDEFEVFYDETYRGRASSIAYIGPSVTPYYGLNPGYRIYHVDGNYAASTRTVLDHETWIMDLQEANRHAVESPRWYRLYTAREAFRMHSLTPQDWDHLIQRMTYDDNLFQTYYK